jgi:hypothetical protein
LKPVVSHLGDVPFGRGSGIVRAQIRRRDAGVVDEKIDVAVLGGDVVDGGLELGV